MAVTNNTAPASDREKREEEPVLREEVFSMGSSFFDDESIQKAKDFLWQFIDNHNKELLIHMANTDSLSENGLQTEKIVILFQYKR